jgi:hypothetical protein
MLEEQRELKKLIDQLRAPTPGPRILVDILFPPFKTTIDDPAYQEKRTITGLGTTNESLITQTMTDLGRRLKQTRPTTTSTSLSSSRGA